MAEPIVTQAPAHSPGSPAGGRVRPSGVAPKTASAAADPAQGSFGRIVATLVSAPTVGGATDAVGEDGAGCGVSIAAPFSEIVAGPVPADAGPTPIASKSVAVRSEGPAVRAGRKDSGSISRPPVLAASIVAPVAAVPVVAIPTVMKASAAPSPAGGTVDQGGAGPSAAGHKAAAVSDVAPGRHEEGHGGMGSAGIHQDAPPAIFAPIASSVDDTAISSIASGVWPIADALHPPSHTESRAYPTGTANGQMTAGEGALADQVALACIRLTAADGARQISLQLAPKELGKVDIAVDQGAGGTTVTLTVDRPETLARLQRDHEQLSQVLDRAGLPSENRIVTYQLAPHDPSPLSRTEGVDSPPATSGTNQFSALGGDPAGAGSSGGGGHGAPRREVSGWGVSGDASHDWAGAATHAPRAWQAGLNITA